MPASDIEAITQVVMHERQGRDRRWWDQMREQYWPDAEVHLSWFSGNAHENVDSSAVMNADGNVSTHRLSPLYVHVEGDRALVEMPTAIEAPITVDGTDAVLTSYLRIQYRVLRRDGAWRVIRLDTIYERDTLTPTLPGTALTIDPAEVAGFRRPFRLLAWFLAKRGYSVLDDLLGEDRPDEVTAFYDAEQRWLLAGS